MGKIVNRTELAEIFGSALTTVDVWVREGLPIEGEGGRGKSYAFDTAKVHAWLLARERRVNGDKRKARAAREPEVDPETGETRVSLDEAQRRKAVADAQKSELDLAQKLDLVAPISVVAKVVSDEIANARARLLAIPVKVRPEAQVCCSTPEKTKRLVTKVEDLIRDALTEIKSYGGGE